MVPRFERPYSWTLDNVGDLWTDAVQESPSDYFLGVFIVYDKHPGETRRRSSRPRPGNLDPPKDRSSISKLTGWPVPVVSLVFLLSSLIVAAQGGR